MYEKSMSSSSTGGIHGLLKPRQPRMFSSRARVPASTVFTEAAAAADSAWAPPRCCFGKISKGRLAVLVHGRLRLSAWLKTIPQHRYLMQQTSAGVLPGLGRETQFSPERQVPLLLASASFHSCGTSSGGHSHTLQSRMAHMPSSGQKGQSQYSVTYRRHRMLSSSTSHRTLRIRVWAAFLPGRLHRWQ